MVNQSCGESVVWRISLVENQSCGKSVVWKISRVVNQSCGESVVRNTSNSSLVSKLFRSKTEFLVFDLKYFFEILVF